MKNILSAFATLLLAGHAATAEPSPRPDAANGIPFADSLEAANVTLPRMFDGQRESLILGNGDLYGIVWEKDSGLFMRITKNDIWDARVDTSKDGELPRVDIASHKITGPGGAPPGYGRPYPQPRCAAALRLGPELSTAKTPPKFKHRSPPPPPPSPNESKLRKMVHFESWIPGARWHPVARMILSGPAIRPDFS